MSINFSFYLQAYEVVHCRWNNNYERQVAQSKTFLPQTNAINFLPHMQTITINNSEHNVENIMINTPALNFSDPRFMVTFLSGCSEANTSLCPPRTIPKVTFNQTGIKQEKSDTICESTDLIEKLIVISHLLLAINSSANVIIYMLKGERGKLTLNIYCINFIYVI